MNLNPYPGEVFANTADFDRGIRLLIPEYKEMLGAIARCLPATASDVLVGCGTGELSLRVSSNLNHPSTTANSGRLPQYRRAVEVLQLGGCWGIYLI